MHKYIFITRTDTSYVTFIFNRCEVTVTSKIYHWEPTMGNNLPHGILHLETQSPFNNWCYFFSYILIDKTMEFATFICKWKNINWNNYYFTRYVKFSDKYHCSLKRDTFNIYIPFKSVLTLKCLKVTLIFHLKVIYILPSIIINTLPFD